MANYYKQGDYNVICDRTGQKVKRSRCVKQWDNLIVLQSHAEERHPQDLLPPGRASKPLEDARPEPSDTFLNAGDVTVDDL
jgi:hypothetical protein